MFAEKGVFSTSIHTTFAMINMVVISVEFSIQQCLNYLSSMHSLSASDNGNWLFLNRFLCSKADSKEGHEHNN